MIDKPRQLCHKVLMKVFSGGYSNIVLYETLKSTPLSGQDKAFFTRLFYGVLERKITLEYILSKFLKKEPPLNVKTALLMGAYQYLYLDSVPDFAAVNVSCELIGNNKMRGFVNAVLRNLMREDKQSLFETNEEYIRYSVSEKLYKTLKNSLGEKTEGFLEASFLPPPLFIKVNTRKIKPEELKKSLNEKGITARETELENALLIDYSGDVLSLSEFKEGLFFIEDLSSQIAVESLDIKETDLVLDLCSAPGGKSFSASLKAKEVHSFDIYENKINLLNKNAKRLSLPVVGAVLSAEEIGERAEKYDKVICDVPCSGTGVLRRKPEIRYKAEDFMELIALQRKIMITASKAVLKGGKILYSTCSVNREENGDNLKWFLEKNQDFRLLEEKLILPEEYNSDGFYFAVIERCL